MLTTGAMADALLGLLELLTEKSLTIADTPLYRLELLTAMPQNRSMAAEAPMAYWP